MIRTSCMVLGLTALTACQLHPRSQPIIPAGSQPKVLWDQGSFTEGPAVAPDGTLLFTDLRRNLIRQYDPETGETSIYRENSGSANGLAFDASGNLLACEGADGGNRRISITAPGDEAKTLADQYEGMKFNSPNDIAVSPNGDIYFTDPRYRGPETVDLDFEGVFLIRDDVVSLATSEVERPNGILVSPDGYTIYIADNNNQAGGARSLLRFWVSKSGNLGAKKVLYSFTNEQRGIDGMAMDVDGNIYAAAGKGDDAGVYIFNPKGRLLGVIELPDLPTNCTFGGPKRPNTLFMTAQVKQAADGTPLFGLFSIELGRKGYWLPQAP